MNILVVSPNLPHEGVVHAGGEFLLRHLEALHRAHNLTLLVPGVPQVRLQAELAPAWLDLVVTPFDPDRPPDARAQWDRLRRRVRYRSLGAPALRGLREVGFVELAEQADLVELHWTDSAILVRELRRAGVCTPVVVVAYDVTARSLPAARRRLGSRISRAVGRLWDPVRTMVEGSDLAAADLVLTFSDSDESALRQMGVRTPVIVVEPPSTGSARTGPGHRAGVLFTGAMWRSENQDGVRWFLQSVWPAVLAEIPSATFTVVGAEPPAELVAVAATARGVHVTGTVPSLEPWYQSAAVFVAPLFVPGGLKFKVPDAMSHGLPVIATSVAVDGLRAPEGVLWAVTDDAEEMARAVVDALQHPSAASEVGAAAARWCEVRWSFTASAGRVMDRYCALVERHSST